MNKIFAMLSLALNRLKGEEGQDLVEYALVVALIALAATAGMKSLASDINAVFVSLGTQLSANA